MWTVGTTYEMSDCQTYMPPELQSYTAQVIRVRHDGNVIMGDLEYGYQLCYWDNPPMDCGSCYSC